MCPSSVCRIDRPREDRMSKSTAPSVPLLVTVPADFIQNDTVPEVVL